MVPLLPPKKLGIQSLKSPTQPEVGSDQKVRIKIDRMHDDGVPSLPTTYSNWNEHRHFSYSFSTLWYALMPKKQFNQQTQS